MQATFIPKDIDRLLAEADELIKQIDSNAIKDLEEEHRIQFETHAQSLKKLGRVRQYPRSASSSLRGRERAPTARSAAYRTQ